ncbi:hypothetical protein FisN_5Lh269 [Fistulifera solaris]|uniref:Uncharacterized protein n=1 Tax=Fistulifera solaris TaxID=1519565 RepID=A0A1Z5JIL8_FISSO|nr:hypothetical protein FisN_5Lh269 [Fistulifera solaris]|eukprot:GAX13839.1 hypothetical protein FisN_5Lh269 [Fistulifera solaris]
MFITSSSRTLCLSYCRCYLVEHGTMATLLEEALATQTSTQSELLVEVYCHRKDYRNPYDFVALTQLAVDWNAKLDAYPWWHRPCFDVHVSEDRIPYLRAKLIYCDVRDCWYLVGLFLNAGDDNIVVKFWDDGDLLLTEAAYHLPDWVHTQSDDEMEYCRNRCWIQNGQIILLPPPNDCFTVGQALSAINENRFDVASDAFQQAIQSRVASSAPMFQRTAIAVPRRIAYLLQTLPQVGNEAAASFIEQSLSRNPQLSADQVDWVWTTCSLGRTQYAALRTAVSRTWPESEQVPFRTPELNRLMRQAANDATPHLQNGVALGVRIVAGLQHLISETSSSFFPKELAPLQRWPALLARTGSDVSWFLEAFQAGPNRAAFNLDSFLKLDEQCTIIQYGSAAIRSTLKKGVDHPGWDGLPRRSNVDEDESWMVISDDQNFNLDEHILEHQVESFLRTSSEFDGIPVVDSPSVNPVMFLNILQATLKATVPEDLEFLDNTPDPYFSVEDYELADDEEEYDDEGNEETITMKDVMNAMDLELMRQRDHDDDDDIVTNWKQSLEENAGRTGPVQTFLRGLP